MNRLTVLAAAALVFGAVVALLCWHHDDLAMRRLTEQGRPRCSMSGRSCQQAGCCAQMFDRCFQQHDGVAYCRASCSPGTGWSCQQPFAHPLAKARQTEQWPDLVAVCSAGMVLVQNEAYIQKYNASCDVYCHRGAGPAVRNPMMFGLIGEGLGVKCRAISHAPASTVLLWCCIGCRAAGIPNASEHKAKVFFG
ncbi:unnamed protein product [Symbiodinium necroappetens]|uniref:Uncharacterized protein n=1 Tax=Symbiodinium necroappetens TaxID=1628268 RepID=A0A812K655_9DINO|nr:unnamed protein product [Symbiodinium necroappetens]